MKLACLLVIKLLKHDTNPRDDFSLHPKHIHTGLETEKMGRVLFVHLTNIQSGSINTTISSVGLACTLKTESMKYFQPK